jgi:hypothetical protein
LHISILEGITECTKGGKGTSCGTASIDIVLFYENNVVQVSGLVVYESIHVPLAVAVGGVLGFGKKLLLPIVCFSL